ncbi:hypothetical protein COT87_00465 [Candidatus Collierbacteria bacterium CG10_big_fil_rev_8_21_14_0_10_44_9]|uniref:DUF4349 domain-containing protein n=1 Tax=Candidatus Collierbacteria bacterium CG10_big_fil_rev_8_21_14_0_10_44_9 TaxID=1974535 RepID=A0A2H0VJH0_9BACT|nr:MAG: hypothetical protein COT87_00465 [Candidatus Collierbacteria bacterium CG10_big_fil_rev_8_21_14_0_10_44_9]
MAQNERRIVKISRRKVKLVIATIVIALIAWVGISLFPRFLSSRTGVYSNPSGTGTMDINIGNPESAGKSITSIKMPSFRNNEQVSINDTREFLKTNYSATIKTRDVQNVVSSAKNIVKGNDGRIDNLSSSEKSGYLTFVVPKSKFETFREEIEGLTHKKLFSETSSSQNLLNEKISIEEQTSYINTTLESLKQQKESLLSSHTQTVSSINRELALVRAELKTLRTTISETEDQSTLDSLRSQESSLVARESRVKQNLTTENSSYSSLNTNLDNQIKNQNTSLANVEKQDVKFTQNIETVSGNINVNWISIWQMIKAFSPIHPSIIITVLVLIVWSVLSRLGYVPKFILE